MSGETLPQPSHITKKEGVFYYRRRLPKPYISEVAISLRTRRFRFAEALAGQLDAAFHSFFAENSMPAFDIQAALRAYLQSELAALKERHLSTPFGARVHGQDGDFRPDAHERDLQSVNAYISVLKEALAMRASFQREEQANAIIGDQEATFTERVELALGLIRADLQVVQQAKKWLTEGLVPEISLDDAPVAPAPPATIQPAKTNTEAGSTLSAVLPRFLKQMVQDEGWRGQTLKQNTNTYEMFRQHCGDRAVQSYSRRDVASFFDVLREMPSKYGQDRRLRGKAPAEIAELTKELDVPRMTMKTVKRHSSALGRLFTYLKARGEFEGENPAHGHEFPMKGRKNQGRQMWEGERLRQLFHSPVWQGCLSERFRSTPGVQIIRDDKFWLPLLGLYHGNRLEEFAQLTRRDLGQEGGIWFLQITDEGEGQQLKNEQSKRRVPIHPELLRMGFVEYAEKIAPKPDASLFPELKPGGPDGKKGFYFTKWWSRYRQAIGVGKKGYDYHSFRHSVTNKLAANGVPLEVRNQLLGREGKSVDEQVYLKELPLPLLADAIGKVAWPELEGLFTATPYQP
jgi:integrase